MLSFSRESVHFTVRVLENDLPSSAALGHFFLFQVLERRSPALLQSSVLIASSCLNIFWSWYKAQPILVISLWIYTYECATQAWAHYSPDTLAKFTGSLQLRIEKACWTKPYVWLNKNLSWICGSFLRLPYVISICIIKLHSLCIIMRRLGTFFPA